MASTHRIHNEIQPASQLVVVHTATTATATYRSSTPFEVFEENRCAGGLIVKNEPMSSTKGTTSINYHVQGAMQNSPQQTTSAISPYSSSVSNSNSAPVSSAMGSTLNSVCPMDSFGNVTFGANRENALTQWLYEMFHCINNTLFSPQRAGKIFCLVYYCYFFYFNKRVIFFQDFRQPRL